MSSRPPLRPTTISPSLEIIDLTRDCSYRYSRHFPQPFFQARSPLDELRGIGPRRVAYEACLTVCCACSFRCRWLLHTARANQSTGRNLEAECRKVEIRSRTGA